MSIKNLLEALQNESCMYINKYFYTYIYIYIHKKISFGRIYEMEKTLFMLWRTGISKMKMRNGKITFYDLKWWNVVLIKVYYATFQLHRHISHSLTLFLLISLFFNAFSLYFLERMNDSCHCDSNNATIKAVLFNYYFYYFNAFFSIFLNFNLVISSRCVNC